MQNLGGHEDPLQQGVDPVFKEPEGVVAPTKERRNFCPICGDLIPQGETFIAVKGRIQHRCSQRRLDAIDRAMKCDSVSRRNPTYGERLELAEVMISMIED